MTWKELCHDILSCQEFFESCEVVDENWGIRAILSVGGAELSVRVGLPGFASDYHVHGALPVMQKQTTLLILPGRASQKNGIPPRRSHAVAAQSINVVPRLTTLWDQVPDPRIATKWLLCYRVKTKPLCFTTRSHGTMTYTLVLG